MRGTIGLDDTGIEKWRQYAKHFGFVSPIQAEKDYIQEILLLNLFSIKPVDGIVFRGGTALSKLYASGRFSEDLDFIAKAGIAKEDMEEEVGKSIEAVNSYYDTNFEMREYKNMLKYEIKVKGPIYRITHNNQATQTVRIDLNTYERPCGQVVLIRRVPVYSDIIPYYLYSLTADELVADKIKAILERRRRVARDAYDLWILFEKYDAKVDMQMLDKKLELYGKEKGEAFSKKKVAEALSEIGRVWEKEMKQLASTSVPYGEVKRAILSKLV